MYAGDRRLSDAARTNATLLGECIGGALHISDFIRICHDVGFASPREVSSRPIAVDNPELRALTGEAHFSSITFRCFKAEGLERTAEDYGHVAVYRGGVVGAGSVFVLDSTNAFEKDRPRLVCGPATLRPCWHHRGSRRSSRSRARTRLTLGHFASSSFRVQLRVATEEGVVWGVPACNGGLRGKCFAALYAILYVSDGVCFFHSR